MNLNVPKNLIKKTWLSQGKFVIYLFILITLIRYNNLLLITYYKVKYLTMICSHLFFQL
jgi:hypothetical protein